MLTAFSVDEDLGLPIGPTIKACDDRRRCHDDANSENKLFVPSDDYINDR